MMRKRKRWKERRRESIEKDDGKLGTKIGTRGSRECFSAGSLSIQAGTRKLYDRLGPLL